VRSLLLVSSVTLATMIVMDREAQHHYLVHFVAWMISLTAVAGAWWWERRSIPRPVLVAAMLLIVLVQAATIGRRISQRALLRDYFPVTSYLSGQAKDKGLIMGSAELAFRVGFIDTLVDDQRLGFRSGKRPNFVVIDRNRYAEWIAQYEQREPDTYRYIRAILDREFHVVMENGSYTVYARNGVAR